MSKDFMQTAARLFLITFGMASYAPQHIVRGQAVDQVIKSQSEEVLVDVTVRDEKGRAVHDLAKDDFQIYDNGAAREVRAFRQVQGRATTPLNRSNGSQKIDATRQLLLTTLVFDQMDLSARDLARQAASELLKLEFPPNVYMSVFQVDHGLRAIAPFTRDRELLMRAIEKATGEPNASTSSTEALTETVERLLGPNLNNSSMEERVDNIKNDAERQMMQTMLGILRSDARVSIGEKGRSVLFSLMSVIRGQAAIPGKKAVLLFSPGFSVFDDFNEVFKSVIDAANRGSITFFSIDAGGLRTTGGNESAIAQLKAAARTSMDHANSNKTARETGRSPNPASIDIMLGDTAANSGKYNTQDTLSRLADATGGFLVANTNDLREPVRKILEDLTIYYELSYVPDSYKYDGSFHKINVQTRRSGLRVWAKSGYFALPPSLSGEDAPLNISDVALLNSLNTKPATQVIPFESGSLYYRDRDGDPLCEIITDVPLSAVTLKKTPSSDRFEGELKFMVLIKDESSGNVVKTLHGELPLVASMEQLESVRNTRFTNIQEAGLRTGHYTVGVAVLDVQSGKTSARFSTLVVPLPSASLAMSSVALIRSWRPKEPEATDDDPLVYEGKSMTPTLTPVIRKSESVSLPFYLIVYPNASNSQKPELALEFEMEGKTQRVPVQVLPMPDRLGRIQYLANTPIAQFTPGNYSAKFAVRQGSDLVEKSLAFVLAP